MPAAVKIDFISDVSCPWCAVGLWSLQQALAGLRDEVVADLRFQPFELNPKMGPGGQDIAEHLTQKYGSTPEQQAQIREVIRQRGAEVGFTFNTEGRGRIYNTFDAHRLLHWAGEQTDPPGAQLALKQALLKACHEHRRAMDEHPVLLAAVREAGLDEARAAQVLASDAFAQAVRQQQAFYAQAGIHSVPAVIVNDRHLISGGQPVAAYQQALRQIVAEGG